VKADTAELLRFVVNGVCATAVHFGVLTFNLHVLRMPSAGLANFIAAGFGITASFLGNRSFVFKKPHGALLGQAVKFLGLYGAVAVWHGMTLFLWTDWLGLDYRYGFVLATAVQVCLSYLGNKWWVFNG